MNQLREVHQAQSADDKWCHRRQIRAILEIVKPNSHPLVCFGKLGSPSKQ